MRLLSLYQTGPLAARVSGRCGMTAVVLMLFGGLLLSLNAPDSQAESPSAEAVLAQAISVYDAAKARGHAWVMTRDGLAKAQGLLDAGDAPAALVVAQQALETAEASLRQADIEAKSWQARVPK